MILRIASFCLAALLLCAPGAAAEPNSTGFHFLELGAGARTEALGGTGATLATGADALSWNPALLASETSATVSASLFRWMGAATSGYLAAARPMGGGTGALGVRSLSVAEFDNTAGAEAAVGQTDLAVEAGYARTLRGRLDAGASLGLVRSALAGETASGWVAGGGLLYRFVPGWNLSVGDRDFGSAIGYGEGAEEPLPTRFTTGVAGTVGDFRFGVESEWRNGFGSSTGFGVEYGVGKRASLRAGARVGEEPDGGVDPWALGAGFLVRPGLEVDYAFRNGAVTPSHRFGVRWTPAGSVARETGVLSRVEYFSEVAAVAVGDALSAFPEDVGAVLVRPMTNHRAGSLLTDALATALEARGLEVKKSDALPEILDDVDLETKALLLESLKTSGSLPDSGSALIEVEVVQSEYLETHARRARWIGPRSFDRTASVGLTLHLTAAGEGDSFWTAGGAGTRSETVAEASVPESTGYPPRLGLDGKNGKSWKSHPLVEPAIVGGIVTGLVLVFFANQDVGE